MPEKLGKPVALTPQVLGRLRWDSIRSRFRIQTSAQLLDGPLFHWLARERSIEEIGVPVTDSGKTLFPFHVTTIGTGIESSLRDIATRPFMFSSIAADDWQRLELQSKLKAMGTPEEIARRSDRDGTIEGIVGLLEDTGAIPREECERLGRAWKFWAECENDGRLVTRQAKPYGDDTESFLLEGWDALTLETQAGRATQSLIRSDATRDENGLRRRSLVWQKLDRLHRSDDPGERRDAEVLRVHFDRCYYRTIADAEGSSLSLEDDWPIIGKARRHAAVRYAKSHPDRCVIFRGDIKLCLGQIPRKEWETFTGNIEDELNSWWADPWNNSSSMKEIIKRLEMDYVDEVESSITNRQKAGVGAIVAAGTGAGSGLAVNPIAGAAVGLATWILTGPAVDRFDMWNRDRKIMYDIVEMIPTS
ncbi:hypothetical protein HXP44_21665 [Streptomyces sioyaensis]|uniref:Uncharacterized protein n=1 Tax=Streptomyces sioyaensis TaxID=67364 RepID=A0A4Q1QL68_9ACTN|nr:hypothetical protein [Streptomyces sioyaensis]MBM4794598.1 hypothetical protein [Streptomyces sioyaensis]RXS62281.1 hypothetical protein EST54_25600 [Streptomyces sioyaensis]